MLIRVLDTSVVAKWFFKEEGTDRAEALLMDSLEGNTRIEIPSLLFYELANVVWTRQTESFGDQQARMVWAELTSFPLRVTDWSALLPDALTFAIRHEVTVYDAVFVVLARQLGGDLITADRVLWDKVAGDCPWVKMLSQD
ncbi:MAG TPA: type II toxin-antitoxin system VapC family toxin [Thermoanaerobaculia bacterium]